MPQSDKQRSDFPNCIMDELMLARLRQTDPIKWAAMQMTAINHPGMTVGEAMDEVERVIKIAFQEVIEERDELRSALCIARENARTQHGMTLRKFAVLCGHSPTWVSRWTSNDSETPNSCEPPDLID